MNIALITPSSQNISAFGARSLAGYLKQHGHRVRVVTLPTMPDLYRDRDGYLYAKPYRYSDRLVEQVIECVRDSQLVGLSFMTQYFHAAVQLTEAIRKKHPVPILWGGVHPTVHPDESLRHADLLCLGEGEEALLELAGRLEQGRPYADVANLAYLKSGRIVCNPVRPLLRDLDTLPFLDYGPEDHFIRDLDTDSLEPFSEDYFKKHLAGVPYFHGKVLRSFMYFTTRGCPFSCTYCVNDFYRRLYGSTGFIRKMSCERVVAELETTVQRHPCIEEIEFCDDNFALRSVEEIREFSALYKKRVGLPFQLLMSPLHITEEKIAPLIDAGLVFVETGIQSAAEGSRQLYNRHAGERQLLAAADVLHNHRDRMAPPCYHLILDNPFETEADTLETLMLTLKLPRPFWFKRSSLVAFPGTSINQRFREAGLLGDETEKVYLKVLEMPSTSYLNFLFLLNNQNYPRWIVRLLAGRRLVHWLNRPFFVPVVGSVETLIRLLSRLRKGAAYILRGDWQSVRRKLSGAEKTPRGMISSRPPAF